MGLDHVHTSPRFPSILFGMLFLLSLFIGTALTAQASLTPPDTTLLPAKRGSIFKGKPGRAMLYSLLLPGSGQWYNGSILRAHVAWGAVGGMGYVVHYNTVRYKCIRDAYIARVDHVPFVPSKSCPSDLAANLVLITDPSRLRVLRDQANKDRQLSIVIFSLVWLANGIDAFVDAQLKDFDISDDLSFQLRTIMEEDPYTPMRMGLVIQF